MNVSIAHASRRRMLHYRLAVAGLLAAVGCHADLLTKRLAFEHLGPPQYTGERRVYWLWPEFVGFETSVNLGALGGLGSGHTGLLAAISAIAMLGLIWWLVWGGATQSWMVTIAVGLIMGGIMGNLYDRLGLWGMVGVRDWILLQYRSFIWPNFNIADSLLVVGSLMLVWHTLRSPSSPTGQSPESAAMDHVEQQR